jgi:prepilin-type processing-associated H-X9-DG protein
MMLLIEEARDTETGGIGINDCVYMTDQNYTNDQPGIVHYDGTNILYLDGHARWKRALELRRDQDNREWMLPQVISR